MTQAELDQLCINTIRTLSMDAVQAADSGHPGTPMALAPVVYQLWNRTLQFDPQDPIWPNRDRFVLSAGHASMLLYSLLHLTKTRAVNPTYERLGTPTVSLDDIKKFRQLDSKCPGHPEYHWTSGVETTTGPLGQGYATSVGMAIARRWLAARYNQPGMTLFDYDVYALGGDGCMMEGVSSEAASLAGHLGLSELCWIYDNNRITIEGSTALAFTEDVATRFIGYGWNVTRVGDANDLDMLARAFRTFQDEAHRPTLIIVDSHIGFGSHKQDSHSAHGSPLGDDEIRYVKKQYGWPLGEDAKFGVPDGVYDHFAAGIGTRGDSARKAWEQMFAAYGKEHAALADEVSRMQRRDLPAGWDAELQPFKPDPKGVAGRQASAQVLNAIAKHEPWLVGGSADLAPSTLTRLTFEGAGDFERDTFGRNFHFGIREHAMGAALNGMALSKLRVYGSGFFVFSDYMRPAIRLAAIMELPVIYIFTHDSIGVGEDGPTHQPIEHLASLRAIPGLIVLRPGDANEVLEAWRHVMELKHEPAVLVLSRQAMPTLDRTKYAAASGVRRGAYVLADSPNPEVILIGTGTEVALCVAAHEQLVASGVRSRVVSMPSWEMFEAQDAAYRDSVLPAAVTARVAVEQGAAFGWERYVGRRGQTIAMHTFGASAPLKELQTKFGFQPDKIVQAARTQIAQAKGER
ncbi:MAG TPA: transketolase [Kofleriaceae bacterium]|nr:transketolase [Kofleriaceae bacterium]